VTVRAVWRHGSLPPAWTADQSAEDATKLYADAVSFGFREDRAGPERPYFLMGDASDAVYLLRWETGKGVLEATANGPTKIAPIADGEAAGKAVYAHGQYRLVIKRPLAAKGPGRPTFQPGVFTPVAFQAWDGSAGETGAKMSLRYARSSSQIAAARQRAR
jgi:DMSO reductase family type II enzyme heme b subunit